MKIGVDLDDVLSKTTAAYIKFHNDTYGTNLKIEDKQKYGWWELFGETREEYEKIVNKFYTTHYFTEAKPIEEAIDVLKNIKGDDKLYVITARGENIKEITEKWIEKNFPGIFSKIYYTNQFEVGGKKTTKAAICNVLDVDVFIDDGLDFALDCASPNREVLLLNYPWNQTKKLPAGITRVYSWGEIGKIIDNLHKK